MKCQLSSWGIKPYLFREQSTSTDRHFPRPQLWSWGTILLTKTFGFVPRLQPKIPNIGSGQNSDSSTTGTGKSVKRPMKLPKQEVLHMQNKLHFAQQESSAGVLVSSFLSISPRKTKLPYAEKPSSIWTAGTWEINISSQVIKRPLYKSGNSSRKEKTLFREAGHSLGRVLPLPPPICIKGICWCLTNSPCITTGKNLSAFLQKKVAEVALAVLEPPMQSLRGKAKVLGRAGHLHELLAEPGSLPCAADTSRVSSEPPPDRPLPKRLWAWLQKQLHLELF